MLQFQQHLFHMFFFFAQMTSYCFVHYDVIYYPFPVNNLKMSGGGGVDSPGCLITTYQAFIHRPQSAYPFQIINN